MNFDKWTLMGLCSKMTVEKADAIFFDSSHPDRALSICAACPVQQQCREAADRNLEAHGVWGGEGAVQRRSRLGINKCGDRLRLTALPMAS